MHRQARRIVLAALLVLMLANGICAWYGRGHRMVSRAAVAILPAELPAFFRQGAPTIAECCVDPDLFREGRFTVPAATRPDSATTPPAGTGPESAMQPTTRPALGATALGLSQLHAGEAPEHFLDTELLQGKPLPATRYEFARLCDELRLRPATVGLLPYAIAEWTQRLTVAFAEHRRWPDDPAIQAKCLVYAGLLAHYAGDACQPLHCTIDFDGRTRSDGSSPRSGIHAKVDGLFERVGLDPATAAAGAKPASFKDLLPAIMAEISRSKALVDRVYELEGQLPSLEDRTAPVTDDVRRLAQERFQAAAQFTASLYITAWEDSAKVALPAWLGDRDSSTR
jgi:hypothetical protein